MKRRLTNCLLPAMVLLFTALSCANPGTPDGGPYDETPPHIIGSTPTAYATGFTGKRITLEFDEIIKLTNAAEKIIISPPQLEMPEIAANGRRITVELKDTLKPNTTYTIDFGDAIEDNNEGNPMGDYAFVFATGQQIDTLQISGHVLEASDLEPIKGILVGLQSDTARNAFRTRPFDRVGRTNGSGYFTIKGVAPGRYRIYALNDADGDFIFGQKSEKIAFLDSLIVPSCMPAMRNDTIWADSIRIDTIRQVQYTRFLPDDVVLRAFTETMTDRHLLKTERPDHTHFTIFFTATSKQEPDVRGVNFDSHNAFIINKTAGNDTITYWLRDTNLVKRDTLVIALTYDESNDSTGLRSQRTDTIELVPRISYERILKRQQEEWEEWNEKMEKYRKKGKGPKPPKPRQTLNIERKSGNRLTLMDNLQISVNEPLDHIDSTLMHLQLKVDTNWVDAPYLFEQDEGQLLRYSLYGEWRYGQSYRLQIDSAALRSIYGRTNDKMEIAFSFPKEETYGSLFINLHGTDTAKAIVQLINSSGKVIRSEKAINGHADFYYLQPAVYYMRTIIDRNGNGQWDTGEYDTRLQPEEVFYYPGELAVRARWDIEQDWYVENTPLPKQKPAKITKQKPDQKKRIQNRNAERERQKN